MLPLAHRSPPSAAFEYTSSYLLKGPVILPLQKQQGSLLSAELNLGSWLCYPRPCMGALHHHATEPGHSEWSTDAQGITFQDHLLSP